MADIMHTQLFLAARVDNHETCVIMWIDDFCYYLNADRHTMIGLHPLTDANTQIPSAWQPTRIGNL